MKTIVLIITIASACSVHAQVDTTAIKSEVLSLQSKADHVKFWNNIYATDQGYRGKDANDSIDILNLIKCCYYLNQYGFPIRDELGGKSQIVTSVWIHNRYPQTDLLTFPIIMEGLRTKQIEEVDFRWYYIKGIYNRKFDDDEYKSLPISELMKKTSPRTARPIDIHAVLEMIDIERNFLLQPYEVIGEWYPPEVMDTFYVHGKTILNHQSDSPIRIFVMEDGEYYYHRLHDDGSHYPQQLTRSADVFQITNGAGPTLEITPEYNLQVIDEKGKTVVYTSHTNRL